MYCGVHEYDTYTYTINFDKIFGRRIFLIHVHSAELVYLRFIDFPLRIKSNNSKKSYFCSFLICLKLYMSRILISYILFFKKKLDQNNEQFL